MPTFYNFTENGLVYSFDDIFVPADIFREGNLWTWGNNLNWGRLGNASLSNTSTPVTTFAGGSDWKQVSTISISTAAIKTDGTLWAWGGAFFGSLGNAVTTGSISTPVTTFAGGSNWKQVSCGGIFMAAIKTDGTLWVWGWGDSGRLGNAVIAGSISTPVTTFAGGSNWKQVSSGNSHTSAIKTDGTLWVWGFSNNGILGNGVTTLESISTPVTTFAGGNDWKQVSCGNIHTAAIKTDGTLWVWGNTTNGTLGNAVITGAPAGVISTPVTTFAGGSNWKQVSASSNSVAAIKTDGTLWTWGAGNNGRLGNTVTAGDISTPVTTFAGGSNWKQVTIGLNYMTAIKTDGTLWTWGSTNSGVLGNAAVTGSRSTPVTTFAGGSNWKQVSAGYMTAATTYIDSVI